MKKLFLPIAALLIAFLLFSCEDDGELRIVSFRDPDFSNASFNKICLIAYVGDIQTRQNFEMHVARSMRQSGMNVYEGINILPPTRDWTNEEIRDVLLKNGFDACLVLDMTDRNTVTYYTPAKQEIKTETTKHEDKPKDSHGNDNRGNKDKKNSHEKVTTQTTVTETPAYETKKDFISLQAKIIDVHSSNTAWICQAKYVDNRQIYIGMLGNTEFRSKFAGYLIQTVLKDRIITPGNTSSENR